MNKLLVVLSLLTLGNPVFAHNNTMGNGNNLQGNHNKNITQNYRINNNNSTRYDQRSYDNSTNQNTSSQSVSGASSSSSNVGGANTINQSEGDFNNVIPRQAPPAIAPNMAAPGNNSFSGGVSTPFGGVSLGKSTVDGSVRNLNAASADKQLAEAMVLVQTCNSSECQAFKKYLLKRFERKSRNYR